MITELSDHPVVRGSPAGEMKIPSNFATVHLYIGQVSFHLNETHQNWLSAYNTWLWYCTLRQYAPMSQMPEVTSNYYHNAFGLSLYSCALEIIQFPDHKKAQTGPC